MSTPQVKVITDRQEIEKFVKQELTDKSKYDLNCREAYIRLILNQEGWYYVATSPCSCPNNVKAKIETGEQGHNLTCGYYFKGIVK